MESIPRGSEALCYSHLLHCVHFSWKSSILEQPSHGRFQMVKQKLSAFSLPHPVTHLHGGRCHLDQYVLLQKPVSSHGNVSEMQTGEMVQSVKNLPPRAEDLCSVPRTCVKRLVWEMLVIGSEEDVGASLGLTLLSQFQASEKPCPGNRRKWTGPDEQQPWLSFGICILVHMYLHTDVYLYTNMYIHRNTHITTWAYGVSLKGCFCLFVCFSFVGFSRS